MHVLGLNWWLHDSAAALLKDGALVAALEEERWFRDDKHTNVFPGRSIKFCIEAAGDVEAIQDVALNLSTSAAVGEGALGRFDKHSRKDRKHIKRAIKTAAREARHALRACGLPDRFTFHEVAHHDAHAASAFFASPFEEAAVLTLDGRGEWATTCSYAGRGARLEPLSAIGLPHSLGNVYAAMTEYLGFKRNNDEYKVMGLASYGDPARFRAAADQLMKTTPKGFVVNTEHFVEGSRILFPGVALERLFEGPRRVRESELEQRHKDVAAALQEKTEEIGLHLARKVHEQTGLEKLCLAGGVALNCSMNTRLLAEGPFDELYVQPAAHDAGGALGAALWVRHQVQGHERSFRMDRANFGPAFSDDEIEPILREGLLRYRKVDDICKAAAQLLADGKIVGWFQGRAEFGPRALGHRSILADPTRIDMQDHLNNRVKHREDFRPFAPSAIQEGFEKYFGGDAEDRFMVRIVPVQEEFRAKLPAITHVDGTARLQTVSPETNPLYHRLIEEFGRLSGVPVVVNTSFNVRGEPMVLTPKDALRCFFTTGLDHLAIGSFVVDK